MATQQAQWWEEPFRIFQTNIREIDSVLDEKKVVQDIIGLGANVWLLNTAGIVSHYPSELPFQHPSPWLAERESGDLVGDAVREAHANDVRVISRVDFSKVHRDVFEEHPDWAFVSATGEYQIYHGLYSVCPSGPYYQDKSFEILGEVLDRYPIDGFFFNWFNFNERDYSGRYHGICQCVNCRRRFSDQYNMELPKTVDWQNPAYLNWRQYTRTTLEDLARRHRAFVKERNSGVGLFLRQAPDVVQHEVQNAVDRPLPLWRYAAGEFGREARTEHPDKPAVVNTVMFLDFPYRFSAEQPGLVGLHLAQTLSQGVNPWAYVIGTTDQPDRKNFGIVKEMLTFHRDHEDLYENLRSVAKVLLISSLRSEERYGRAEGVARVKNALRGTYRALVEEHVPFDILPDQHLVAAASDGRLAGYDTIVLPNVAILDDEQLDVADTFVKNGGGLVATYDTTGFDTEGSPRQDIGLQSLGVTRITARREGPGDVRGSYLRVTRREDLPGLDETDLIAVDRGFHNVEVRLGSQPSLHYIPVSRFGPPEKIYWDLETEHPGLLWHVHGEGRTAYFPWPVDSLFFDHSLPEHRRLLANAVVQVSEGGRQVITNAPPQIEIVVNEQAAIGRFLVHLVNFSGHQDRSYHDPLEVRDITVEVAGTGDRTKVRSTQLGTELPAELANDRLRFTLPSLGLYDVVTIERS